MSEYYERRLDVLNRGLSGAFSLSDFVSSLSTGYNSRLGFAALKRILAPSSENGQVIRLLTIWFGRWSVSKSSSSSGANDAMVPPGGQHVSLDDYQANLRKMIALIHSPTSPYYSPSTKIVLITPPPFLEKMWRVQHVAWALREGRATTEEEAVYGCERFSAVTQEYAAACRRVAEETGVECVDVHTGMIEAAGGFEESLMENYYT